MSEWITTSLVVPRGDELPFPYWAGTAALHISSGDSVELQRRDDSGNWETFETISDASSEISVANQPAMRIVPLGGAKFKWIWNHR